MRELNLVEVNQISGGQDPVTSTTMRAVQCLGSIGLLALVSYVGYHLWNGASISEFPFLNSPAS